MERFLFNIHDDDAMYNAKREIFQQVTQFDICIEAKGFFRMDRQFVATVCYYPRYIRNSLIAFVAFNFFNFRCVQRVLHMLPFLYNLIYFGVFKWK